MRERLTTLGLALAALLLFVTLFVRGDASGRGSVSVPTTIDRGENGLMGAVSWLRGEGVPTLEVRQRFDFLRHQEPARGNLLIVTLPALTPFRTDETVALDDWIRRGNTLLVLAALSDRPAWARERGVLESDLQLLTGLDVDLVRPAAAAARQGAAPAAAHAGKERAEPQEDEEDSTERIIEAARALPRPRRDTLLPNRAHRLLDGVSAVYAYSDYPPRAWDVKVPRDGFLLALGHLQGSKEAALWVLPEGAGSIVVSGLGSIFTNRALGQADNARLLANLVREGIGAGGAVLFDDQHQGVSDTYDPARFYRDRRLWATLGVVAAVWLAWIAAGTRLLMPPLPPPAAREEDLVRATGLFLARVLRPAAAARRMYAHFFQRLRGPSRSATADAAAVWDWLENSPRVARADVAQLREWYADAYSERRVPLEALHNLMVKTERQLAA